MKDLYKQLKGTKKEIPKKDFKESIINLCEQYLKKSSLSGEDKTLIYRIYSNIQIKLKDW